MFTIEAVEAILDEESFTKEVRYHEGAIAYTAVGGEDSSYGYVDLMVDGEVVIQCGVLSVVYEYAAKEFVLLGDTKGDDFYLVVYLSGETSKYRLIQARAVYSSDIRTQSPSLFEAIGLLRGFSN